ncbi:MAG: SMC family ATPase [Microbacterium sp.]
MKLHSVELEGFGPFRARQRVDFDAFDADGIFLIAGRTGAGKSSILDGVCYALYGTAPRYDGGDRGLRSDHCDAGDPTEVSLEFTAQGRRLRVTRTPRYRRRKARGDGFTDADHTATLEELVDGRWIALAAKPVTVGALLDEVVGLSREQFQQVMLLAQNRFADFLLAKNDDRQRLLRTLFGTRTHQQLQAAFDERRKAERQRLTTDREHARALLAVAERVIAEHDLGGADDDAPDDDARLAAAERALSRARYRADEAERLRAEAEAAHDAALSAHGARLALRDRQARRQRSRDALALLESAEPSIAAQRVALQRARAAEVLRPAIEASQRADVALRAAVATHERAVDRWVALGGRAGLTAQELRASIEGFAGEVAVATAAAAQELHLPELDRRSAQARVELADAEEKLATLDERRAQLPAQRAELEGRRASLDPKASSVDPVSDALATAEARLRAGREAELRAVAVRDAEARQLSAIAAQHDAAAEVRVLLRRRLDGFAGELAAGLVDGEPCAVCGALEHPRPAVAATDAVTDEQLAVAEARSQAAADAAHRATEAARAARAAHADVAAAAGGAAVDVLESAVAEAAERLRAAREAAAQRDEIIRQLGELAEADRDADLEREALSTALGELRESFATVREQCAAARAAVDAARGGFATVAERVATLTSTLDAARELSDATEGLDLRAAAAAEAGASLAERLSATCFEDAAAATAALLPAGEQDALDQAIREHENALAAERDRLREWELELAGAPDELVDPASTQAAAAAAKAAWNTAAERAARDAEVASALAGHLSAATAALAALAGAIREAELITALADAVGGRNAHQMDLETFVLAAELEEIVAAANVRLDEMSDGRYRLQHSDARAARGAASGLGLEVLDAYTGQARVPQSLSGGETFLASLSLALGLAEVVTARAGGIRLDTLFIDEGFGSLDDETLDLALRTLDELRRGGRTVGVISHVDGVKERVPAQLRVEATAGGPSVVRQESALAALA